MHSTAHREAHLPVKYVQRLANFTSAPTQTNSSMRANSSCSPRESIHFNSADTLHEHAWTGA